MSDLSFTHLDPLGRARMVDVTPKEPTHRRAVARCKVFMRPRRPSLVANREVKKGDVLAVARVAGIQAAKRTSDMIPLCHPLLVGSVSVNFEIGRRLRRGRGPGRHRRPHRRRDGGAPRLRRWPRSRSTTCASRPTASMVIGELALWEKTGGRSGTYRRGHPT